MKIIYDAPTFYVVSSKEDELFVRDYNNKQDYIKQLWVSNHLITLLFPDYENDFFYELDKVIDRIDRHSFVCIKNDKVTNEQLILMNKIFNKYYLKQKLINNLTNTPMFLNEET